MKNCMYLNYNITLSISSTCYCTHSLDNLEKVSNSQCQNESDVDRHFNGEQNGYSTYVSAYLSKGFFFKTVFN